jgi:hypothetical protein
MWLNYSARSMEHGGTLKVEITKALAALQPLYGKDNVEIITTDGRAGPRHGPQYEKHPGAYHSERQNPNC